MSIQEDTQKFRPTPKPNFHLSKEEKEEKKKERKSALNKLIIYLTHYRAKGRCEICGRLPAILGLMGHHIIKLSQGGLDCAKNLLILCEFCHNHTKYGSGTPLDKFLQLQLATALNELHGISGELTGYDLDN